MKLLITVCCFLPSILFAQTQLKLSLWLQGAYDGNQMIPVPLEILKTKFPTASLSTEIVDQVSVEIHTFSGTTYSQTAWLQKNGMVVSENGNSELLFSVTEPFQVIVSHRNHLPIVSDKLLPGFHELDFRKNYTRGLLKSNYGTWVVPAGDIVKDSKTEWEINATDFIVAKLEPSLGYHIADVNLDGIVNQNDFDLISANQNLLLYNNLK
ncbi:MAG: hypothetical protein NZ108_06350 [Bacteroidia bacterium]|nr:hypothetical protein [Bacteroidia bacterium]